MARRPRKTSAERAGGVLERVLRRSGLHTGLRERRALSLWPEVIGPALTRVTEPLYLSQGTLVVRVSSSSWRAELHHLLPELLAKLNARLEQPLQGVRLVAGPIRQPSAVSLSSATRPRSADPVDASGGSLEEMIERAREASRRRGRADGEGGD